MGNSQLGEVSSNGGKEKALIDFLGIQLQEKVKQVENATKLYFQSLIVLAAGLATILTALASLKDYHQMILALVTFGIPAFLISWFGCFLFIYWEHHMLRINLDHTEKVAAKALGTDEKKIYLYHEDYLGVFNQAPFIWKLKSVQVVFVIIAVPVLFLCYISIIKAREYFFLNINLWYLYISTIMLLVIILLGIHIQCVIRERKLKKKLEIKPQPID
jgi:hypothetical protein